MAAHPDVAIIGGGIIGLTCAYFLAKEGFSVQVYDRGDLGREASWAGAGIIPPGNPAGAATPIDRLRAIGSVRFPEFSRELRDLTGIDNGYLRCGGVEFIAEDPTEILGLWRYEGIAFEKLSREELRRVEPALEGVPGEPYLLPDCAQVRNPRHLQALIAACQPSPEMRVSVWKNREVQALAPKRAGSNEEYEPWEWLSKFGDRVLIAAGAWSGAFLDAAGHSPSVHPVRGQIVLLKMPTPVFTRVLMVGKRYLVPRSDGHILIGSTEEPDALFEKANTAEAVADLLAFAFHLVPALSSAELVKCWSGLRPATPDGLPFIGPVPGWGNVFVATGHFRAGVQLSIGTAQAITELFTGQPTCVPLEAFAVDRKPHPGGMAAFRS